MNNEIQNREEPVEAKEPLSQRVKRGLAHLTLPLYISWRHRDLRTSLIETGYHPEVLETLTTPLDADLRRLIERRVTAMLRHIEYLTQETTVARAAFRRWAPSELHAICILNSFYQLVLAPLASPSSPVLRSGLVTSIPVRYGNDLTFDRDRAQRVHTARRAFVGAVRRLGLSSAVLKAAHADDLLFALSSTDQASDDDGE